MKESAAVNIDTDISKVTEIDVKTFSSGIFWFSWCHYVYLFPRTGGFVFAYIYNICQYQALKQEEIKRKEAERLLFNITLPEKFISIQNRIRKQGMLFTFINSTIISLKVIYIFL